MFRLTFVSLQVMSRLLDLRPESLHLKSFEIAVLVFSQIHDSLHSEVIPNLDQRDHLLDKGFENIVLLASYLALVHALA